MLIFCFSFSFPFSRVCGLIRSASPVFDTFEAGHPSPFGPFSLLQAPWIDPAYLNLTNLANFGQFGANLGNQLTGLPCPPSWTSAAAVAADHHLRRAAAAADPFALIKGTYYPFFFSVVVDSIE